MFCTCASFVGRQEGWKLFYIYIAKVSNLINMIIVTTKSLGKLQ